MNIKKLDILYKHLNEIFINYINYLTKIVKKMYKFHFYYYFDYLIFKIQISYENQDIS